MSERIMLLTEDDTTVQLRGTADGKLYTAGESLSVNNESVAATTAVWANSALINTAVNIDVALPEVLQPNSLYEITIINPSGDTAINVSVCNKVTIGETAHYPELTSFQIPASGKRCVLVQGWLMMEAGRLVLTNATALGAAAGFTANVYVRKI